MQHFTAVAHAFAVTQVVGVWTYFTYHVRNPLFCVSVETPVGKARLEHGEAGGVRGSSPAPP